MNNGYPFHPSSTKQIWGLRYSGKAREGVLGQLWIVQHRGSIHAYHAAILGSNLGTPEKFAKASLTVVVNRQVLTRDRSDNQTQQRFCLSDKNRGAKSLKDV